MRPASWSTDENWRRLLRLEKRELFLTETTKARILTMNKRQIWPHLPFLLMLLGLISTSGYGQQSKSAQEPKQYTIEQFMATTRVGGDSFSSDEKSILFHSNK